MSKPNIKRTVSWLLVLLALFGVTLAPRATGGRAEELSTLNQLMWDEGSRLFYTYSYGGVTNTGMVVLDYCVLAAEGEPTYDQTLKIYYGLPYGTSAYPQAWIEYGTVALTNRYGDTLRIHNGDVIIPKLVLLDYCYIQVLDNAYHNKQNRWAYFIPSIKAVYP